MTRRVTLDMVQGDWWRSHYLPYLHEDSPLPRIVFGRFLVSGGWVFAASTGPRWIANIRNKRLRDALWRVEYRLAIRSSTCDFRTFPAIIPLIRRRRAPVARV